MAGYHHIHNPMLKSTPVRKFLRKYKDYEQELKLEGESDLSLGGADGALHPEDDTLKTL